MIKHKQIPGGWYVDALPTGEYVALIANKRIETHFGEVELFRGENLLFPRCTNVGGFKFAGQMHKSPFNAEWDQKWRSLSPSYGVSPVIYDNAGRLLQSGPQNGSMGYRFVDEGNRAWTADETVFMPQYSINEWTRLGNVLVGQDNQTTRGIVVLDGVRYVWTGGAPRFIRARRVGNLISIATWREHARDSFIVWLAVEDIPALERADRITVPVPEIPVPPKETPNVSVPRSEIQPILDSLWEDDGIKPKLMGSTAKTLERSRVFLATAVLKAHQSGKTRWSMLYKPSRNEIEADVLVYDRHGVDVISGADGVGSGPETFQPKKGWQVHDNPIRSDWEVLRPGDPKFPVEAPSEPQEPPVEGPPTTPAPPPVEQPSGDVEALLGGILEEVRKLRIHLGA